MFWPLLGILLTASTVQAQAVSDLDRFELFNFCRPIQLVVMDLSSDARAIGLTKEGVQLAVESRLRAARLYTESGEKANFAFLLIIVRVHSHAYNITVHYGKRVTDLATNWNGPGMMWMNVATGTHGGNASHILQELSSSLDEFLAGYLRVNEPACDRR